MKKFLAIFILTFMVLGLLVGCGSKKDAQDESGEEPTGELGNIDPKDNEADNDGEKVDTSTEENENQSPTDKDAGSNDVGNNPDDESTSEEVTPPDDEITPEKPEPDDSAPPVGTSAGYSFKDVTLDRVDGGTVNTADYRGKIIIVNLWATWCPPCKAELPDFSRIASEYSEDVVIIAAHVPSGSASAESYIETNLPDSEIIFAYDPYYEAFLAAGGYESIPQTAIIDQNGVIIYAGAGMLSYEYLVEIIDSLL